MRHGSRVSWVGGIEGRMRGELQAMAGTEWLQYKGDLGKSGRAGSIYTNHVA